MANHVEQFSTLDRWSGEDGENYSFKSVYGTVVEHFGRDLAVQYNALLCKAQQRHGAQSIDPRCLCKCCTGET